MMAFDSLNDFFQMGTHGFYVWSSYGVALLLIVGNLVLPKLQHKQRIKELKQRWVREDNGS